MCGFSLNPFNWSIGGNTLGGTSIGGVQIGQIAEQAAPLAAAAFGMPAVESALGLSGSVATDALVGAGLGGLTSSITGQGFTSGALGGAITGGATGYLAGSPMFASTAGGATTLSGGVDTSMDFEPPSAPVTDATGATIPGTSATANNPSLMKALAQIMGGGGGAGGASGLQQLLFNPVTNTMNLATGLYGMSQANQIAQMAKSPTAPYANQWASQLAALQANPSSITSTPGYQFQYQQGLQALQRQAAAGGYTGNSGNFTTAAEQYGQNYASSQYQTQMQQLQSLIAGAAPNPNAAAAAAQLSGSSLNRIGMGVLGFAM